MSEPTPLPLLIGEIFVDVTVTPRGIENKMRLGGITHAARGFWAIGVPFAAAVIVPEYLEKGAQDYLSKFGCAKFVVFGHVSGAPNVTLIFDPTEVDDQEYETLLRDEKVVELSRGINSEEFAEFVDALVFPGMYDLAAICRLLPTSLNSISMWPMTSKASLNYVDWVGQSTPSSYRRHPSSLKVQVPQG